MVLEKLKKIRDKLTEKEEGEDFIEVDTSFDEEGKVTVKIDTLDSFVDSDRIQQFLREGNIVFLKIKDLRTKNINELKRAVERLKKTCTAMEGDLVGVDEDYIIITPKFARIYRGKV